MPARPRITGCYPGQPRRRRGDGGEGDPAANPPARTLRCAAEAFLDTIGSPNTRRAYAIAIVKTVDALDEPGPIGRSRALELPARRGRQWLHWCARAEELLQLNIEDLDQTGRRAPVKSKGAKPRTRRRGAARHNRPPTLSCVFSLSVVFSAIAPGTPSRADAALADRQREQLSKSSAQVQLVAAGGAGEMDGFGPE